MEICDRNYNLVRHQRNQYFTRKLLQRKFLFTSLFVCLFVCLLLSGARLSRNMFSGNI